MTAPAPSTTGTAWVQLDDLPVSVAKLHSASQWLRIIALSSDVMWSLSGRRWGGTGTATATLVGAQPQPGGTGWPYHPSWGQCRCLTGYTDGSWRPLWGPLVDGHDEPVAVRLPHRDATPTAVRIDGAVFAGWRADGAWVTRTDGAGWPVCRDRTDIDYAWGRPPPAGGQLAAIELACEFGRSMTDEPDQECRLPQRLTSITREGITVAAIDPMDYLDKGLTGLATVDAWISAVNPYKRPAGASVWSPELAQLRARRN